MYSNVACSRLECIDNTSYVFSKWDGSVAVAFKERKISHINHINLHICKYVIYWFQFLKSHSEAQSERTEVTYNIDNAIIYLFLKFQIQIVKNSDNWTTWKNFHIDERRQMHFVVKECIVDIWDGLSRNTECLELIWGNANGHGCSCANMHNRYNQPSGFSTGKFSLVKWEGLTLTVQYYQSNGTSVSASWLWEARDGDFSIIQVSSFHDRGFKRLQLDLIYFSHSTLNISPTTETWALALQCRAKVSYTQWPSGGGDEVMWN